MMLGESEEVVAVFGRVVRVRRYVTWKASLSRLYTALRIS